MPTLNLHANITAFGDEDTGTSNPKMKYADWTVDRTQIPIEEPVDREFKFGAAQVRTIFDGTRTLTVDGTTAFALTVNPVLAGVYRLTATAGTAPGFRTPRALAISGESLIVVVNNNATIEFTLSPTSTPTFAAAQVGDVVFIPDTTTGDGATSPFNVMNVGFWVVLAVAASGAGANRKLICVRPAGEAFLGVAETVAVSANSQFQAFSSGEVQIGDFVEISAGFSTVSQKAYQVTAVTDSWIEFASGEPLPLEVDILPTAAGLNIYNDAQSFIYVETDQEASVRLNGSTQDYVRPLPRKPGAVMYRSVFMLTGVVWKLVIVNRAPAAGMNALVIAARFTE